MWIRSHKLVLYVTNTTNQHGRCCDVHSSVRPLYTAAQTLPNLEQDTAVCYLPGYLCSQNAHSQQAINAAIFKVFNALTWHRQHLM